MRTNFSFLLNLALALIFFLILIYLVLPSPKFPIAPPDAVQSLEDADTESIQRRAYFTNYNREEILRHYEDTLGQVLIIGIRLPSFRLNYTPEEAYTLIRDQTRSTFLEEIVHPGRESIFVNGFIPKVDKDDIWYKGVHYKLKLTVKYVPSNEKIRIIIFSLAFLLLIFIFKEFLRSMKRLAKEIL
mgnify:CR=1 FL=1